MIEYSLSDSEQMVMKCIWDSKEKLALSAITEEVNRKYKKTWKPQTVSTFLSRLVKKGYLEFNRQGRVFLYTPLVNERTYRINCIKNFIKFWNNNNTKDFVCELCDDDIITEIGRAHV